MYQQAFYCFSPQKQNIKQKHFVLNLIIKESNKIFFLMSKKLAQEKLNMNEDEHNYNPLMDEYFDEIHNKHGSGLIDGILAMKKRRPKNVDKNVIIEEYGQL